jgi:3-oxoacyl-[acyl-carrier-protein] synthase II
MTALADVVVTGVGVVSPGGRTLDKTWDFLLSGRSAAVPLDPATARDSTTSFGCVIGDYLEETVPPYLARKLERVTRLTTLAAEQAIDQARLGSPNEVRPHRVAVSMGVALGGLQTFETLSESLSSKGYEGVSTFSVVRMMPNAAAAWLAMQHGWTGMCNTVLTACASGASAIAHGVDLIQTGKADVVVAGGADAPVLRSVLAAFGRMKALSRRNDDPERASRPFDVGRDGFVLGEGAAVLVLEREDHARARQVKALGTILGTAANCDAFDLAAPSPSGEGARRCMEDALASAGLRPEDIGHINAHGTSTPLNDLNESKAIRSVFGDSGPPVTANKGALGHAIGGAGAIELAMALTSSNRGVVPPTANCGEMDPDIDIDVVRTAPRTIPKKKPVLSNSFGFGGHNVCVVAVGSDDEA